MILLNDREVAALREDSLSAIGNLALERLARHSTSRIYGGIRMRLSLARGERRPRCRACNTLIDNRAPVVRFHFHGRRFDQAAYIHQECPTK